MKYFSLFSGIGGFELGIEQAYIHRSSRETEIAQSTPPIKSLEACQSSMGELGNNASSNPRSTPIYNDMQTEGLQQRKHDQNLSYPQRPQFSSKPFCVGFSEIDKYASSIYKKHFPTHKEYGNVTNITWSNVPDFEMLVGGFPCQSFSIAGKRLGFNDIRGTLFFEIARAAQEKHPRLLLLENVKGLLSHDKGRTFGTILNTLDELGYDLQWQVLNSKNFGVPQNRERVFIVGHLRGTPRPEVFPIGKVDTGVSQQKQNIQSKIQSATETRNITYADKSLLQTRSDRPLSIRRLTPTECERLQGFPDGWTEKGIDLKGNETLISDTQRYRCLGNAVTVNVIEAITKRLLSPQGETD